MTDPNTEGRSMLVVHAADASAEALLTEWWHPLDADVESRDIRFVGVDGLWLDADTLPSALRDAGCRICDVVGATEESLAMPEIGAGASLRLRPLPPNDYDRTPIGVFAEERVSGIGYLPREVTAETMADSHRRRSAYGALVVSESRDVASGRRVGIKVLIGPGSLTATPR